MEEATVVQVINRCSAFGEFRELITVAPTTHRLLLRCAKLNPVLNFKVFLFKIPFNISLTSTPDCVKYCLLFKFTDHNFVFILVKFLYAESVRALDQSFAS